MPTDRQGFEIGADGFTGSIRPQEDPQMKRSYTKAPEIKAKQDSTKPRIIDVNTTFVLRTAQAMTIGHAKYEQDLPLGDKNYKHADLKFALGRVNNLILHAMNLRDFYLAALEARRLGKSSPVPHEDELGHAAANLNMLAWWEETGLLPSTNVLVRLLPDVADIAHPKAGPVTPTASLQQGRDRS